MTNFNCRRATAAVALLLWAATAGCQTKAGPTGAPSGGAPTAAPAAPAVENEWTAIRLDPKTYKETDLGVVAIANRPPPRRRALAAPVLHRESRRICRKRSVDPREIPRPERRAERRVRAWSFGDPPLDRLALRQSRMGAAVDGERPDASAGACRRYLPLAVERCQTFVREPDQRPAPISTRSARTPDPIVSVALREPLPDSLIS